MPPFRARRGLYWSYYACFSIGGGGGQGAKTAVFPLPFICACGLVHVYGAPYAAGQRSSTLSTEAVVRATRNNPIYHLYSSRLWLRVFMFGWFFPCAPDGCCLMHSVRSPYISIRLLAFGSREAGSIVFFYDNMCIISYTPRTYIMRYLVCVFGAIFFQIMYQVPGMNTYVTGM